MKTTRRQRDPQMHARLQAWAVNHVRAFFFSLGKLYRAPFASLMTVAVLGIALALPSVLYLAIKNLQGVSSGWDRSANISLYLKMETSAAQAQSLAQQLEGWPGVAQARYISRDQALAEFKKTSGFTAALDALPDNPLPAVVVVTPTLDHSQPAALSGLLFELRKQPQVAQAQLDLRWVQRLFAIMDIARRAVLVLAWLLGLAALLVVGNTIRLDIQNRREEIEVAKLIGATDAFIRRPFLYGGLWYGLLGGMLGLLIVGLVMGALGGPISHLASLYNSSFRLGGLNGGLVLQLLALSALLGLAGSWLSVWRHLRDIEPR
ncbi:MAG: permease-like cell division protein FtsX [Gammaproteobacteria bacterium]